MVFIQFKDGLAADYRVFADGFAGGAMSPENAAHRASGMALGPDGRFLALRTRWVSAIGAYYSTDRPTIPLTIGMGCLVNTYTFEAVHAEAAKIGVANVYWMTHETNEVGRRLYDRVGKRTGFIEYDMLP